MKKRCPFCKKITLVQCVLCGDVKELVWDCVNCDHYFTLEEITPTTKQVKK